ncbi:MAG: hybrid sensor histidine kinase/response regulator [Woeseiaceae bacterium]|nr:hybrid sensor histidine kinase/response regulator [Woeseiaceae bacterium]
MDVQVAPDDSKRVIAGSPIVLIIDDNPADVAFYKRCLTRAGHTVVSATTGEAGLTQLAHRHIDCVLLDYSMPGDNGLTILNQIVADPLNPRVPVILLTGIGSESVAVDAWKAGAADYLSKNHSSREDIEKAVAQAIETARVREEIVGEALALKDQNRRLRQRDAATRRYCDTLSREIRTPLSAAREFVSLVSSGAKGAVNEEQSRLLNLAIESCDQAAAQIRDLLDLTRIDSGRMRIDKSAFDVDRAFMRAEAACAARARERHITVMSKCAQDLPRAIGDENRIVQVLSNLLDNAIDATPDGYAVMLAADCVGGHVRISVADQGCGIDVPEQEKIFDRLYKVPSGPAPDGGLGLGLAIARELIQLHHSKIEVDSTPGKGSTFSFVLNSEAKFLCTDDDDV